MKLEDSERDVLYWRGTRRVTFTLLWVWAFVTFGLNWFAVELNEWIFLGFPLGFYMAEQGDLLIFLLIIWIYNRAMNRLEARYFPEGES